MTNFLRTGSLLAFVVAVVVTLCAALPAFAVEPIKIARDDVALDLSGAVEIYRNQGENFQVSTAPGPDGIVRRIEVEANDARSTGDWAVFALANTTDQQLDRARGAVGSLRRAGRACVRLRTGTACQRGPDRHNAAHRASA